MENVEYRTYDGTNNNTQNPAWGSVNTHLLRYGKPSYYGGKSELSNGCRPNPRQISNEICKVKKLKTNHKELSDFIWAWGQFLDHEVDLSASAKPTESRNIQTPVNDEYPNFTIPFERTVYDPTTGTTVNNPREQINQISAYIDATNVYGANATRAGAIRLFDGSGKLKTSNGYLLPFNTPGLDNAQPGGQPADKFFLAGDVRSNEHAVLTCMHTLFMREHNRQCELIVQANPELSGKDEMIYQRARRVVGALMQVITYEEFLPAILGQGALAEYKGYNPATDASINNLFSTASYRLGHSMLSPEIKLLGMDPIRLRDMFFTPQLLVDYGIDPFIGGLAKQVMQEIDPQIVDDVRNFLFGPPDTGNNTLLDLASLNIQRGRDHGLPDYNQCRSLLGLKPKRDFSEITSIEKLANKLKKTYDRVDYIDPWIGGLVEDYYPGANVGELIFVVLKDQFERLRDGDRFWYEHDPAFSQQEREQLKQTRLSNIILANTDLNQIQENVFYAEGSEMSGSLKTKAENSVPA